MSLTVDAFYDSQRTGEVKKYTTDMSNFLPAGASISSASANYVQTYNGSASGSCATAVSGGSVTHTSPALSTTGTYTFTVSATVSDGEVRKAVWYINVDA